MEPGKMISKIRMVAMMMRTSVGPNIPESME